MLLIATMLDIPWWLTVPGYFIIGTLWACFYLPRRVKLMARAYHAWREDTLEGRQLKDALGPKTDYHARPPVISTEKFRYCRDRDEFSEKRLIASFIANIAFWPVRIPQKILTDYMVAFWRAAFRLVRKFFSVVWRLVRKFFTVVWRVVRNLVTWLYRHVQSFYQAIILRANREAIADLKKLEGGNK